MFHLVFCIAVLMNPITFASNGAPDGDWRGPRSQLTEALAAVFTHPGAADIDPVLRELWTINRSLGWYHPTVQARIGRDVVRGAVTDALARVGPTDQAQARRLSLLFQEIIDQCSLEPGRKLAHAIAPIVATHRRWRRAWSGTAAGAGLVAICGFHVAGLALGEALMVPPTLMSAFVYLGLTARGIDLANGVVPHLRECESLFLARRLEAAETKVIEQ